MKIYTVVRLCSGKSGGLSSPCVTFTGPQGERLAKDAADKRQADITQLFSAEIVQQSMPGQPEPPRMRVADLLSAIGIEQVVHFIHETEARESDLTVLNQSKIILAH